MLKRGEKYMTVDGDKKKNVNPYKRKVDEI